MRKREIVAAIKAFDKAIDQMEKITKKYPKQFKEEMEDIGRSVIDEWYNSYDRHLYEPYGSLYYAYRIDMKNGKGSIRFSPEFMDGIVHHQDNQIIYNNAFLDGYHGGSTSIKDGITEPTWRQPVPYYTEWYEYPATRSFSPYEKMHDQMQAKADEIQNEYNNDLQKINKKLQPHIRRILNV